MEAANAFTRFGTKHQRRCVQAAAKITDHRVEGSRPQNISGVAIRATPPLAKMGLASGPNVCCI
jgi:hypothetical protein